MYVGNLFHAFDPNPTLEMCVLGKKRYILISKWEITKECHTKTYLLLKATNYNFIIARREMRVAYSTKQV